MQVKILPAGETKKELSMGAWKVVGKYQGREGEPEIIFNFKRCIRIYITRNLMRRLKNEEPKWGIVSLRDNLMMLQFPENGGSENAHKITRGGLSMSCRRVGKFMKRGHKYSARAWVDNGNVLCDLSQLKIGGVYASQEEANDD